jgi:integrase/recombinase XerD
VSLLKSYLDDFLTVLSLDKHYSTHTITNYRRDIHRFQKFCKDSDTPIQDITIRSCRNYLYHLEQDSLSPKSMARHIASLRSFWNYLIYIKKTELNPWTLISIPKISRTLPHILTENDMHAFLDNLPTTTATEYRDKTICECLYGSGLRVSELIGLNLSDLVLENGEMRITGKGNKERLAIFGHTTKEFLRTYINTIRPLWCDNDSDELFVNQRGTRLSVRSVQRMIKAHALKQNISSAITPHTFRHSFATALFNGGADLRSIQELLGHSSLSTTQIYTHLSIKKLQDIYLSTHPRAKNTNSTNSLLQSDNE